MKISAGILVVLAAAGAIEAATATYRGIRGEPAFRRALQDDNGVAEVVEPVHEPVVIVDPNPDDGTITAVDDSSVDDNSNDIPEPNEAVPEEPDDEVLSTDDGDNEGNPEQVDSNDNENIPEVREDPIWISTDENGDGNHEPDDSNDSVPDPNAPVSDEQVVDSVAVAAVQEITTCFTIPDIQTEFTTDVCFQDQDNDSSPTNAFYRLAATYYTSDADPNGYTIKYLCNCVGARRGFAADFVQETTQRGGWTCFTRPGTDASSAVIYEEFLEKAVTQIRHDGLPSLCAT